MLDGVAADARKSVEHLTAALVSESAAYQSAALLIAGFITSWTTLTHEQLEQVSEAGGIAALVR